MDCQEELFDDDNWNTNPNPHRPGHDSDNHHQSYPDNFNSKTGFASLQFIPPQYHQVHVPGHFLPDQFQPPALPSFDSNKNLNGLQSGLSSGCNSARIDVSEGITEDDLLVTTLLKSSNADLNCPHIISYVLEYLLGNPNSPSNS
jgi:hypothetical protein